MAGSSILALVNHFTFYSTVQSSYFTYITPVPLTSDSNGFPGHIDCKWLEDRKSAEKKDTVLAFQFTNHRINNRQTKSEFHSFPANLLIFWNYATFTQITEHVAMLFFYFPVVEWYFLQNKLSIKNLLLVDNTSWDFPSYLYKNINTCISFQNHNLIVVPQDQGVIQAFVDATVQEHNISSAEFKKKYGMNFQLSSSELHGRK